MIGVGTFKVTEKARRYVNEVLTSERLSYGPFTQKFEKVFATAHGCRFAIMTNSGTSSLQIALAALKARHKWADGDEVIVPAVTFVATSNIVIQNNMKPVFVDVDPTYYELDPSQIEAAITPRTRAIIPVHLFGAPCDMEKIMSIAHKHKLRVIEDSCETMFTKLNGVSVGSFGDVGCFSTYMAHILTTGVGGLCTTNDPELAINLRSLMNHGRDSIYLSIDDDDGKSKEELEMIIQRRFSFVQMGYSYRATEMEGALGLAEFENHEEMMTRRWENGHYFIEHLKPLEKHLQLPKVRPGAGHAFMMFPIVLKDENKKEIVNYLEAHGIETRDMLPLVNQPYYRDALGVREDDFPIAKWINNSGFYIASHQGLSDIEKEYIVGVFHNYFQNKNIKKEKSCLITMSKGDGHGAELMLERLPLETFDEYILVEASRDALVPALFSKRGFKVIQKPENKKGELLSQAVASTQCENIVVMGLDGADDPKDLNNLLIKLKQGNDLVIASRFMTGGGRETSRTLSYRSFGNRFFTFLLSIIFTKNITDSNNLYRGFKKRSFERLNLKEAGEAIMFEMTAMALQQNLKIVESPTFEHKGIIQRKKSNRLVNALTFVWILCKQIFRPSYNQQAKISSTALKIEKKISKIRHSEKDDGLSL